MEIFGSSDGLHLSTGNTNLSTETVPVTIVLSSYGIKAELDDTSLVFANDGEAKQLSGTVTYDSVLTNPNIRLRMYRRLYNTVYSTSYELVDFQDYVTDTLTSTNVSNAYLIIRNPRSTNTFEINLETDGMLSGTYRLDFELYDNNAFIGKHPVYIVIKDESYAT